MRRYSGYGTGAVGTNKTILTLISATTIKPHLDEVIVGCAATPADQAANFQILRFTAVGTEGGGFTPVLVDPDDPASLADCGSGVFAAEPTYTANSVLLQFSMHQRNTFRWLPYPGHEIIAPASANNGLGLKSVAATGTATHEANFHWSE
jgi:hypothetical protein